MPDRIALKISEEALAMIGDFTGAPTEVLGDDVYILFKVISVEPLEFNAKFMTEEQIFVEVKNDSNVHIVSM